MRGRGFLFRHGSVFGTGGGLMVTGNLSITFLRPVPIDSVVQVEVGLVGKEGNRYSLEAEVRGPGGGGESGAVVYAEAGSTFHELERKWKQ